MEAYSQLKITCWKSTIETVEKGGCSGVFIVNFKHISHLFLVFLLLTLDKYMLAGLLLAQNKS